MSLLLFLRGSGFILSRRSKAKAEAPAVLRRDKPTLANLNLSS